MRYIGTYLRRGFIVSLLVFFAILLTSHVTLAQTPIQSHAVLKKNLDGAIYLTVGSILKFKYLEEYADKDNQPDLTYNVYGNTNTVVLSNTDITLTVNHGDNRYSLDVSSLAVGIYRLEVVNEKNEKWYLRFEIPS